MEMTGERLIPANREVVWNALNDPALLQRSIAGCESFEPNGENAYKSTVAVKIGPVSARFNADISLSNIQAPQSYTINFDGKGGVAGFGKGSADIALEEQGQATLLKYNARAQVGGKLAQIGSRLIDAASAKLTGEFFTAFEREVVALSPEASAAIAASAQETSHNATDTALPTTSSAKAAEPKSNKMLVYGVAVGLLLWLAWMLLTKNG
jgi:uncharacterized protein